MRDRRAWESEESAALDGRIQSHSSSTKSDQCEQRVKQRLTEIAALLGTPVGSTETTSGPGRTDTVGAAVLVVILTSSDGLKYITSILSGPLLPKFGGSSRHRGGEEGLRSSGSSKGGKCEGEESEGDSELHHLDCLVG